MFGPAGRLVLLLAVYISSNITRTVGDPVISHTMFFEGKIDKMWEPKRTLRSHILIFVSTLSEDKRHILGGLYVKSLT